MKIRLNKYIAQSGFASRREADRLIEAGRVKVNGKIITELGQKIESFTDKISVDGKNIRPASEAVYIVLNKPEGYLVTRKDPFKRNTVYDLLPPELPRVFPVGRLDYDSEGLLLLTNDGELTNRLLHPRYNIKKIYRVKIKGTPNSAELERLEKGIYLDEKKTAPAVIRRLGGTKQMTILSFEIHEGRKREVRRMCEAIGCPVLQLKRIKFAGLVLGKLGTGQWRHLSTAEVKSIKRLTGVSRTGSS